MEQTEYYQLSLWDEDDRILREDFNSDNAAIDAALAQIRSNADRAGTALLKSAALAAAGTYLQLSLADLDWGQYSTVTVLYQTTLSGSNTANVIVGSQQIGTGTRAVVTLYPMFNKARKAAYSAAGVTSASPPTLSFSYADLQHVTLSSAVSMPAGTSIEVWGRK